MTDTDIKREVLVVLDSGKRDMPVDWIVHALLSNHAAPTGPEAEFDTCCRYGHVRFVVRATLQAERQCQDEEDPKQLILPGYDRLQKRYITKRDGDLVAVPLTDMTDAEIRAKIAELRRNIRGAELHIRELERYLTDRSESAAA